MDASGSELVKLSAGPLLISTIINWALFGILSVQVFLFSQAFPNDRSVFKTMVYGVYLLETAQSIVLTVSAWATFVNDFGRTGNISLSTFTIVSLLGAAVAMVVQTFYAYRIMIISEKKIIPSFILLMSLTSFVAEMVIAVTIEQVKIFEIVQLHTSKTSDLTGIWLGTSCTCDILIAACMCFYLSRRIRGVISLKTQTFVSRTMRMTVETGALTASVSIVSLALYYAPTLDGGILYTVPISALAKLHSNTMLALLNSRMKLGILSESTTWQEHDLPLVPVSHPRRTEIKFASSNTSENTSAVGTREEAISIDEGKITSSGPHSREGVTPTDSGYTV